MNLYISKKPESIGGGSNTFSWLFCRFAKKHGHKIVKEMHKADRAVIIAHLSDEREILKAKQGGCRIIHRLDEHFEPQEDEIRKAKHQKIIELNRLADVTVFQSEFVFNNVNSYLNSKNYTIIYNGNDPDIFSPAEKPGEYIGHVSWGVGDKKRLDLLHEFIIKNFKFKFLLIGRHKESEFDFKLPNVTIVPEVKRKKLAQYYHKMKMLYFPSENDPCPNTVIEAIMSGVPVCYNQIGGTMELVNSCGRSLNEVFELLDNIEIYRSCCLGRTDLYFDDVFKKYLKI